MDDHAKYGAVLITGASTGIGRDIALHLDRLGFNVYATVRNERDAHDLCLEASPGLVSVLMDVTDPDSIERARDQVSQAVGKDGLAGLVNNAGVGFISPLEYVPMDELRWLFDVNFFGLLAVTQAFLPLIRQGRGRIVNISSTASIFVVPFHGPYTASKFAVNALSDALRLELKPLDVQLSVIVCGNIKTPIWEKGISISDQVSKRLPPQAMELYGEGYRRVFNYFARIGKIGVPPEMVSRNVVHALTARRAKNVYYVGPDAKLYSFMDKFLFGRLRDSVVMRNIS